MYVSFSGDVMVRKTKEEAEQTRNAILDAALDIFCTKGYARTTFDDIAGKINLTKGAVYWHFKNKPELLIEVIKKNFYENHCRIKEFANDVKSLEDLRDVQVKIAQMVVEDANYRRFLYFTRFHMEWSEGIVKTVGNAIRSIRDIPLKELTDLLVSFQKKGEIKSDLDIEDLTLVLLSLWEGMLSKFLSGGAELRRFPEVVAKSFDLIIKSIKNER